MAKQRLKQKNPPIMSFSAKYHETIVEHFSTEPVNVDRAVVKHLVENVLKFLNEAGVGNNQGHVYDALVTAWDHLTKSGTAKFGKKDVTHYILDVKERSKIDPGVGVFESPAFEKFKKIEFVDSERRRRGMVVREGIAECPVCHGNKTSTRERQTRSADEPMTLFHICYPCNKRWRT